MHAPQTLDQSCEAFERGSSEQDFKGSLCTINGRGDRICTI